MKEVDEKVLRRRELANARYAARKHDPEFMALLRARNRAYTQRKRAERDPKFLASKSRWACARAKRKRKSDPVWVQKQLDRTKEWRKKKQPKYECEKAAKRKYNERNKDKLREKGRAFAKTEEGRKYFREWARKRAGWTPELFEANQAVKKLNRVISERVKNEQANG